MKHISVLLLAAVAAACVIALIPFTAGRADDGEASPIFGVKIPAGYRQWELVAVSHEAGLDELRGILGNDVAMKAYRDGTLPFPDGTILAKLAWKHVPLAGIDGAFVTGAATTVQIMVKDAKNTHPPAAGGSAGSLTANLSTRRSTKHASPATRLT
jgi:Cytochrome P460